MLDSRFVATGSRIPASGYADQPYLVSAPDGAWVCVLTTGSHEEGEPGQHILALRSADRGQTWVPAGEIEPATGPEASWAVLLAAPSGRIFVFYVYNADDLRELPADEPPFPGGRTTRMDSHGVYAFRWSDDGGRNWSRQRGIIPVREFEIDRANPTRGQVRYFWNVGRPLVSGRSVFLPLHKVAGFGVGWFTRSEGAFVRSDDLLTAADPSQAAWETLPVGEAGLRTPAGGGPIAEEQCLAELSDGTFFCVYRSIDGHPVTSYSRDRGRTWQAPVYAQYRDGRPLKHPRAACFVWKLRDGGYVLWFHNHGGPAFADDPGRRETGYLGRNPAWMARGVEIETLRGRELRWEDPEIVLYDDDPGIRLSYPDLKEEGAQLHLTETQKSVARVHVLPDRLARVLRQGAAGCDASALGAMRLRVDSGNPVLPELPELVRRSSKLPNATENTRAGLAIELMLRPRTAGTVLLLAEHSRWGGLRITQEKDGIIAASFSDGQNAFCWRSDPLEMSAGVQHLVINLDAGPRVISFFVDGQLHDGGAARQYGWGRFSPYFRGLPPETPLKLAAKAIHEVNFFPGPLLAAEVRALAASVLADEAFRR